MFTCLVLASVIDSELFSCYVKGYLPTLAKFGGRVLFRSIDNVPVHGTLSWDAIALQEWPEKRPSISGGVRRIIVLGQRFVTRRPLSQ
ncbi:MAG: hypothetical protein HGB23_06815 [Chlorobiaceae bacterium]|nr:hypothetical protein [Chlorobiaceae bacterium]